MRSPRIAVTLIVAALATLLGVAVATAHAPPNHRTDTLRADPVVVTGAVAPAQPDAPAPRYPLELLTAFAAIGATAKKTRRASGAKRSDVPLIVDSEVHVVRDDDDDAPGTRANAAARANALTHGRFATGAPHKVIPGGTLVDDTDLSDEEIEDLQKRGVVRPAKPAEIKAAEQKEQVEKIQQLQREQEQEVAQLKAEHEQQRAKATTAVGNRAAASPEQLSKLTEQQSKELTALQEKHMKALNAEQAKLADAGK